MACPSSRNEEENMADFEKSFEDVMDAPASILRYGIVEKLAMQLSIDGPLASWKNVADKLNFSNLEISGHYANFSGSKCAFMMLNDWIFKRNGKIGELVKVLLLLELYSCLEDLKEDLEKYRTQSKIIPNEEQDQERDDSSRTSRLSNSMPDSTTHDSITFSYMSGPPSFTSVCSSDCSSRLTSLPSTVTDSSLSDQSALPSLETDTSLKSLPCPDTFQGHQDDSDKSEPSVFSDVPCQSSDTPLGCSAKNKDIDNSASPQRRSPSDSVVQYIDRPASSRGYIRSLSDPEQKIHNIKSKSKTRRSFFKRSKSMEPDMNSHKKKNKSIFSKLKRDKKKTKTNKTVFASTDVDTLEGQSCEVQGVYVEEASNLKPNLSPLVGEESSERPVSSGSEDSLPYPPSSPTSPGYESGYHSGDNLNKRIYIVCNPDEEEVFQRALKMYWNFSKKGYECHMFATNPSAIMEVGRYRYEMNQVIVADFVFLCVSKKLKEIFEVPLHKAQAFRDADTKGLRHVSDFIMSFLAKYCCNPNGKFMTILLTEDSYDHVPVFLDTYLKYHWPEQERRMENTIHKRNEIPLPPISSAKVFPPIKLCTSKGIVKASVREDDSVQSCSTRSP